MKRETGIGISMVVAIAATAGQVSLPGEVAGQAISAAGNWPIHIALTAIAVIALAVTYKLAMVSILRAGELTKDTNAAHRVVGKQVAEHLDNTNNSLRKLVATVQILATAMGERCNRCPQLKEARSDDEETSY